MKFENFYRFDHPVKYNANKCKITINKITKGKMKCRG